MVTDVDEAGLRRAGEAEGWADPARVLVRTLDVRDPGAWRAAMGAVLERWGRLDVLINVAGVLVATWAHEATDEDVDRIVDVNTKGLMHGTNAALRLMIARKAGAHRERRVAGRHRSGAGPRPLQRLEARGARLLGRRRARKRASTTSSSRPCVPPWSPRP